MTTDLQRGIEELGAVRYSRGRYAYVSSEEGRPTRYIVEAADMRDFGARLRREEPDAYSLWCAATIVERERVVSEAGASGSAD